MNFVKSYFSNFGSEMFGCSSKDNLLERNENRKANQHLHRSSYQNVDEKGRRAILRIKLEKDSSYYVKSGL